LRLQRPRRGRVDFGDLRRRAPISDVCGFERGEPIDRYYIRRFLTAHAADVRGRVLEVGDDRYTREIGGARVERSDVLHVERGNPRATIVADLRADDAIPAERFDCIIVTQTLQMIYEIERAARQLVRGLRPGGTLLVTSHGVSKLCRHEGRDPWGEYWHLTSQSARRLFERAAPEARVEVKGYGNVLAAVAALHGLAAQELSAEELDTADPDFEVLVCARLVRPDAG
jgi:hypothetical protein